MNEQELMLRIALVNSGDLPSIDSPIGELRGAFGRRVNPAQDLRISSEDLPEGAVGWDNAGRPLFVQRIPLSASLSAIATRGSKNVERRRAQLDHRTRLAEFEDWKHRKREDLRALRAELRVMASNIEADRAALRRAR